MAINKVVYGNQTLIDLTADTITAADLASGKTAHGADGTQIIGTNTYDSDTSQDTATAAEILATKTAHARGTALTGTMPNRGGVAGTIATKSGSYAIAQGYHDGSGSVSIDSTEQAKIIAGNIKSGVEILGVTGDYSGEAVTAGALSATPYLTEKVYLPSDIEKDYFSQVTVAAITITRTDNAAGGVTVTIGAVDPDAD